MSFVYFLHAPELDFYKVGYTRNLLQRIAELRRDNASELELVATLPVETDTRRRDGCALERRFHERYLPWHVRGEWFRGSCRIAADVRAINTGAFDVAALPVQLTEASLLRRICRGPRPSEQSSAVAA